MIDIESLGEFVRFHAVMNGLLAEYFQVEASSSAQT